MKSVLAVTFLALATAFAVADLRFTEKSSDESLNLFNATGGKQPRNTVVALKGRKVKFSEMPPGEAVSKRDTIFDTEKVEQVDVNPKGKTYSVFGAKGLADQEAAAKKKIEEIEKKLGLMSGEKLKANQRFVWLAKKVLGMLPEAPKVELERTGEKQKLGTWDCERVVIREADAAGAMQVVFDCWMTDAVEGWSVYADMYAAYKAFSPGVLAKMKELKGFHVKGMFEVFWLSGQVQKTTFDNSDASVTDVNDTEFVVPEGFKNTSK